MKVGLANLRDAGQLESLLRAPTPRRFRTPALALAAAAALVFIAVGLWRGIDRPRDATLAATASELVDRSGRPLASGSSYALLRTRSSAYDARSIELPAEPRAIELRVRPEVRAPLYGVALSRIRSDGSVAQIGNVTRAEGASRWLRAALCRLLATRAGSVPARDHSSRRPHRRINESISRQGHRLRKATLSTTHAWPSRFEVRCAAQRGTELM